MTGPAAGPGPHGVFDELAVGWALHALEPEEETVFASHLPGCARCRGTITEATEVMADLAGQLPPAQPPGRLRERLQAAVPDTPQQIPPGDPPLPPGPDAGAEPWGSAQPATGFPLHRVPAEADRPPPPTPWRRVLPHALAAGAVAAILALGTWNVVLSTARDEARTTAVEQAEVVNALLTPGRAVITPLSGDDGAPLATVVVRNGPVQVVTHGLAPNDDRAQTYVVWGLADDTPVALGTFDVIRPQMDLRTVGSAATGLDDFSGFEISLEPGRRVPSVPTDVVARGEVTN
ncbi:anti-sigma factor domain-containing protein [Geodermatophilus sp. CPCC 206100]|uniref:anti-sigma factor n=1 Tax=Geodermatophilus sp. CPCC 206100 TaxID=3020054 RepID=UPI003B004FA0